MFFAFLSFQAIKTRFAEVLESEDAVLAAVTLPKFKLRWLRTQDRKDKAKAKASLLAECRKLILDQEDQQAGTSTSTRHLGRDSAIEDEFFSFEDEDDTSSTTESQITDYFKSGAQEIDSLNGLALIKKNGCMARMVRSLGWVGIAMVDEQMDELMNVQELKFDLCGK